MPEKRVTIRRVKTSDLIAMWEVYSPRMRGHAPGSVAFGPACTPAMPEVADRDAVWLRYTTLSLQYPGLGKLPAWCRYVAFLIAAKLPFALDVMPDSVSHFATFFPSL